MFVPGLLHAQELRLEPPSIVLAGARATQRVLALETLDGKVVADKTRETNFTSSNTKVVSVDESGTLRAVGDGEATITALTGELAATAKVKVVKTRTDFEPSFRNHVQPILTRLACNSGACHGALAGKGGLKLSLRGYASPEDHFVLTRQANARRVNMSAPAHSLMLLKPTMALPHGGGQKLDVKSPEYSILADWIASGAPGPADGDARLTRIEAFPAAATLQPKDQMQVLVRAHYSDGSMQDVTRWAKFSSTEEAVANVDEQGLVKVIAAGEMGVSVLFGTQVALVQVTVPREDEVDSKVFADSPRHNFIDEHILKKLQTLGIPPSPPCSDREFIRRAYLDAAGILPTPAEVEAFLKDNQPDKRARLIDALLQRPEFIDYWAYKWSDLLLISSRKLSQPAMRAFYQYVRQSVSDNKPWDEFAREILTASGSNLKNGAANYFVLHKDVSDLTESTSVTFLGMSLTCARCHNHPLERWTQDQYWSLANLFAQVGVKNGERKDELTVHSRSEGDVLHPRRGFAMPPTPLDAKPVPPGSDRRAAFAAWLTDADNPYFARAIVNRIWRNYMGRGLVEAEDDLRQTNPASNEELLAALAQDFIAKKYDTRVLMRTILNSATYQRSSVPLEANKSDDRFYSRYLVRRLPAEVVLDAYSDITKVPTQFTKVALGQSGGRVDTGDYPLGTRALQLPDTQLVSQFLDAFGRPERGQTCACERQSESSVTQALHLNNGQTLNDKLRDKNSRVEEWLKENIQDEDAIARVFALALSRPPTTEERVRLAKLLAESRADPQATRREALEDLFWSVLTSREFLFNR
jgi:hypothetical protein